jgi:hypothetical protein
MSHNMSHIDPPTDVATQLLQLIADKQWIKNATSEQMVRLRREMEMEFTRATEMQARSAAQVALIVQAGLNSLDQVRSVDLYWL